MNSVHKQSSILHEFCACMYVPQHTGVTSGIGISKSLYNIYMYYILQFVAPGVVVYIIHYTAAAGIYCIAALKLAHIIGLYILLWI